MPHYAMVPPIEIYQARLAMPFRLHDEPETGCPVCCHRIRQFKSTNAPKAARRNGYCLNLKQIEIQGAYPNMRPTKVILCVDDNEQELSVLAFMLTTNGYRVLSALNGPEAIGIFSETSVDLVLSDFAMPQMNGDQLVGRLKQMGAHVPMILLGDPQKMGGELHAADALLAKKNCSAQELLERIKTMSARKRGPRKGSIRIQQVPELAVAS
jgi:two-component system response regulator CpxR